MGCGLLIVVSAISLFCLFRPVRGDTARFLRKSEWALFFCAVWIFATVIPFDVFFATRSASVTATLSGVPISQSVIQSIEKSLGISPVYNDSWFCEPFTSIYHSCVILTICFFFSVRLLAIIPWFAFAFAVIAGVFQHIAASRTSTSAALVDEK